MMLFVEDIHSQFLEKKNRWYGITGQLSPLYGKKQSEKSKNANSISHIGRKHMHDPITDKAVCVKPDEV